MADKTNLENDFNQLLENIPFDKYGIQAKSSDADSQLNEDTEKLKEAPKEAAADADKGVSNLLDSADESFGLKFEKFANKLGNDAKEFADDAAEKISKNTENAYEDVKDFVRSSTDSISEKASDHGLANRMHEQLENAKDTMSSASKSIGNEAKDAYESSSNWFKDAVENFNNWLNVNRQESQTLDEAMSAGNKPNSNVPEVEQSDADDTAKAIHLEDVIGHHSPDNLVQPHYNSSTESPQNNELTIITDNATTLEYII